MEMLPPAPVPPNVVVGAMIVKRFPGYGEHRGTIAEIDGNTVVVHWTATDEGSVATYDYPYFNLRLTSMGVEAEILRES